MMAVHRRAQRAAPPHYQHRGNDRLVVVLRRSIPFRAGLLTVVAIIIAIQPLGVLAHFVHDHHDDHSHVTPDGLAIHLDDAHAADHDADHFHEWTTPGAAVVKAGISQPQLVAALDVFEDVSWPSAAPFPPFSPPRA